MKCKDCKKNLKEIKGNEDILFRAICDNCGLLYEITNIDNEEIEAYKEGIL